MPSAPSSEQTSSQWLRGFANDPDVFLYRLDTVNRRALLLRLDARRIREAPFLDERALAGDEAGAWLSLAALLNAELPNTAPQGAILHCGHCGSTLISRLLGELPGVRMLREPLVLQALAAEARVAGTPHARLTANEFKRTLALTQAAFAKAPSGTASVVVKHTSSTANLAPELLSADRAPAFLCLWIPVEDYLATMLREESLREGVRQMAEQWVHDLVRELGPAAPMLADLADAELAALNWTAAQLAFARLAARPEARILAWQFADFLADPRSRLIDLARHFGLAAGERDISAALAGPWLRRYAKDPRYAFDAHIRERELGAARKRFGDELARGVAFARRLWARLPLALAPAARP